MLNLGEDNLSEEEWNAIRKEIEKVKEDFIRSGKIGGNPLEFLDGTLKSEVFKNRRR